MNIININEVDVNYLDKINLRTLFTEDYSNLPNMVDYEYVIYCIHNDINGKCYIGQAEYLYWRFTSTSSGSHLSNYKYNCINGDSSILYRAITKYNSRSFTVYALELCNTYELLDSREKYWIKTLHTCIYDENCYGYNMNWGGSNRAHLNTWESRDKALESIARKYNGDCAGQLHTPEATRKAQATNKLNHGGILAWHTEEARRKGDKSRAAQYNGDPQGQIHTKEAYDTNRRNHGGRLSMHTLEAFETNRRNHGGVLSCHTPEALIKSRVTRQINCILKNLNILKNDNAPQPITWDTYWNWSDDWSNSYRDAIRHISKILENIDNLRRDSRWTKEMESIFSTGFDYFDKNNLWYD